MNNKNTNDTKSNSSLLAAALSPENRVGFIIALVSISLMIASAIGVYVWLAPDSSSKVKMAPIDSSRVKPEADAKVTQEYRDAIKNQNEKKYKAAAQKTNGVTMPFVFDKKESKRDDGKDISNCDCRIDDEQLINAMNRLGINGSGKIGNDHKRIGTSDVYISTTGQLIGPDGIGIKYQGNDIFIDSNGNATDDKGIALIDRKKSTIFIGENGEFLNKQATNIALAGDLLTSKGVSYVGNGRIATRPGNMMRVGSSDVYVTIEGLEVTMDGKPIKHSGMFVFRDEENKLINRNNMDVAWEGTSVYQNNTGQLVNASGSIFKSVGIIFSYDGIMIDNEGKLTRPLIDIERISKGDLFTDKKGNIVDGNGLPITHYGIKVRLKAGTKIVKISGKEITNRKGDIIFLSSRGVLKSDVGKASAQTGILKTSEGVAYDRKGELVTRRGKMERRGKSDIYTSIDGLVLDKHGKALIFKMSDAFTSFSDVLHDGSQALETLSSIPVTDSKGNRVYLSLEGMLVDKLGNLIRDTGILSTSDGVVITSSGQIIVSDTDRQLVTTKDGKPVTFNGKEVFKGEDGRLYDADGNPILSADGRAVYMDENGNLVDEFGRIIDDVQLMAGEREVVNGELSTRKKLTSSDGSRVLFDNKDVYVDSSGRLVDENGKAILSKDGRELFMDKNGNLVDKDGNIITEDLLFTEDGKSIKSNLIVGREQIITKSGKAVKFNGKDVYKGTDGSLYDADGNPLLTKDGKRIYLDENGNLIDSDGNLVDENILKVYGEESISNSDLSVGNVLTDANGNPVKYNGKDVIIGEDGLLLDENGNPILTKDGRKVFMDENGNLVDEFGNIIDEDLLTDASGNTINEGFKKGRSIIKTKDGKPVKYKGENVSISSDGSLLDKDGNPILTKDGRKVFLDEDGNLVDEYGNVIDENLLSIESDSIKNVGLTSVATSSIKNIGNSGIYTTKDGLLLDKDGKALKFNGKNVRVGKNGQLLDEDGNPVVDKDGNAVYMNSKGELVDKDGNIITDSVLTNNNGELLDSSGNLIKDNISNIGGSDLYTSKDGRLVDKNGRALKYNGKDVYVGEDGALYDKYGRPITDAMGNSIFVDSNGNLIDSKGNKIKSSELTNADGVLIDSSGELITAGGKLTKIPGTNLFKTKDGQVVDENGKPIQINGKDVFIDDDGRMVDRNGKPIKFKRKEMFLGKDGRLVDRDGQAITNKNSEALFLGDEGGIVNESGISEDESSKYKNRDPKTGFSRSVDPNQNQVQRTPNKDVSTSVSDKNKKEGSKKKRSNTQKGLNLDKQSEERLARRYSIIKKSLEKRIIEFETAMNKDVKSETVVVGGTRTSGIEHLVENTGNASEDNSDNNSSNDKDAKGELIGIAGDLLYAVLDVKINTDFSDRVSATIVGRNPKDKLYKAKMIGKITLKYEHVVISFNNIVLKDGTMVPVDAIALDPATGDGALTGDVDTHFWYRYGGLFLSSILEGTSEAMSEAGTREESTTTTGTKVTTTGLDGDKLALRSLGKVGEAFTEVTSEFVKRPITVQVPAGQEMAIKLFTNALMTK